MLKVEFKSVTGYQPERPMETDMTSSKGNVYIRQNIRESEDSDGNTCWKYDEAFLSEEEYAEYLAEQENPMLSVIMQKQNELQLQIYQLMAQIAQMGG